MELFVRRCVAMKLKGFDPQELANTINGEVEAALTGTLECWAS
jgi:hypothetical protein